MELDGPEPADGLPWEGAPQERPRRALVALHVAALTALALTHPLLEVIGNQPEFLIAHEVSPLEAVALLVALAGLLPAAAGGAAAALTRRGHGASGVIVGSLVAVLLLRCARLLGLADWSAPLACYLGAATGLAYARAAWARSTATAAVPALVLVPALFFASPARVVFRPRTAPKHGPSAPLDPRLPSVVVIVLDEVNLASLLGPDGGIDADRFPNLAAFARQSTWFRNATASADETHASIRALHSGRLGARELDPAKTLFGLLPRGYAVRTHEQVRVAQISPPELRPPTPDAARSAADRARVLAVDLAVLLGHAVLPEQLAASLLPRLPAQWYDLAGLRGDEPRELSDPFFRASSFVRALPVETGPTFYYLHMFLPHRPWCHLASGLRYATVVRERRQAHPQLGPGNRWPTDERWVADHARRYLLQLGAGDELIGELFTRLEQVGRWDETLVVVLGDHGIAFTPGSVAREAVGPSAAEVAPIPLLIKLPGQRSPRVSDRNAETIDILPTIADALDLEIPWEVDGASLLDEAAPARPVKRILHRNEELVELPSSLVPEVLALRSTWARLVGEGPLETLPLFSPYAEALAGRRREELEVSDTGRFTLTLHNSDEYEHVDPASAFLPGLAFGRVDPAPRELTLAVLLDGVVVAFARTLPDEPGEFEALLPERSLHPGRNALAVLVVSGPPDAPRLERARPAPRDPGE